MELDKVNLTHWAFIHETDYRIIQAIAYLAEDEADMQRMWENPTECETVRIWKWATQNGTYDDTFLAWGQETLARVAEGLV